MSRKYRFQIALDLGERANVSKDSLSLSLLLLLLLRYSRLDYTQSTGKMFPRLTLTAGRSFSYEKKILRTFGLRR